MSQRLDVDRLASSTILNIRAWALQERYLARRIMFLMKNSISWKCRTSQIPERGYVTELGFWDQTGWIKLLQSYTYKDMANASDRLYALRGIVEVMKHHRQVRHHYEYGAWESRPPSQILWRKRYLPPAEKSMTLPTWTWA